METINRIILGDNQFFGINHMSQEKAQQLAEQFHDIENIYKVYRIAYESGIRAFMLNSHARAFDICKYFKEHESYFTGVSWYPSIPYAYKYANLVAEKGILPAINEVLFEGNTTSGVLGMIGRGGMAVLTKDAIKLMQMLVDVELRPFRGMNIKVAFLQNIVTDLMLGYGVKEVFYEFCVHIRKKYNALPGFITQNMPYLISRLEEWGINEVVICSSFNKIGYLMSPDLQSYIDAATNNDPARYQLIAMSTLASGAIPAREAYEFINRQNIQSVVFGASSRGHIEETFRLIKTAGKLEPVEL
jgi:hypothetical protein